MVAAQGKSQVNKFLQQKVVVVTNEVSPTQAKQSEPSKKEEESNVSSGFLSLFRSSKQEPVASAAVADASSRSASPPTVGFFM